MAGVIQLFALILDHTVGNCNLFANRLNYLKFYSSGRDHGPGFTALGLSKMKNFFLLTFINRRHFFDINFFTAVIFLIFGCYMYFFFLFSGQLSSFLF